MEKREIAVLAGLAFGTAGVLYWLGPNSAAFGALLSLMVSQLYFVRRSRAERLLVSTIDTLRKSARLQIHVMAGARLHPRRISPSVSFRDVRDCPTIISAKATLKDPKFLLLTVRDNGLDFAPDRGLKAVGIRSSDRMPLEFDAVGLGLVIVYLRPGCSRCEFTLTDEAGNNCSQTVSLDET